MKNQTQGAEISVAMACEDLPYTNPLHHKWMSFEKANGQMLRVAVSEKLIVKCPYEKKIQKSL